MDVSAGVQPCALERQREDLEVRRGRLARRERGVTRNPGGVELSDDAQPPTQRGVHVDLVPGPEVGRKLETVEDQLTLAALNTGIGRHGCDSGCCFGTTPFQRPDRRRPEVLILLSASLNAVKSLQHLQRGTHGVVVEVVEVPVVGGVGQAGIDQAGQCEQPDRLEESVTKTPAGLPADVDQRLGRQ